MLQPMRGTTAPMFPGPGKGGALAGTFGIVAQFLIRSEGARMKTRAGQSFERVERIERTEHSTGDRLKTALPAIAVDGLPAVSFRHFGSAGRRLPRVSSLRASRLLYRTFEL